MGELIVALLTWIAAATGLPMPPPPPVVMVSKEQMSVLAFGRAWRADDDVPAAYDYDVATVYLRDDWNSADLRGRATLVHELVHHVQQVNDVKYDCPAAREPLAYDMAIKWLREQGEQNPYAVLKTDAFTIAVRSMCQKQ